MTLSEQQGRVVVIGSSGGIGAALVQQLSARGSAVVGLSRSDPIYPLDISSEASIEAAARRLEGEAPLLAVIVATGLLHAHGIAPEKTFRELDQASLLELFAVNAIGPALVAKHFIPLLPRQGRCIFAALSARVGSIGDNRLGGWYGYRASKAALNMLIKTLAIEVARSRPDAICVGLHPGTVDTKLSQPFQRNVSRERLFTSDQSANHLIRVLEGCTPLDNGKCFDWSGVEISP